jgi:hypothetical protein
MKQSDSDERPRRHTPTEARLRKLVERSSFDLRFAHEAALQVGVPFAQLAKIKRARREMSDLARELESVKEQRSHEAKEAAATDGDYAAGPSQ